MRYATLLVAVLAGCGGSSTKADSPTVIQAAPVENNAEPEQQVSAFSRLDGSRIGEEQPASGSLSREDISQVIRAHLAELSDCYLAELNQDLSLIHI